MSAENERRLLSRKEAAETYGFPPRFLEIAAMRGDGPKFVKLGRLAYYRPCDIEQWLDERTVSRSGEISARSD